MPRLITHPGVGPITALAFVLTLGPADWVVELKNVSPNDYEHEPWSRRKDFLVKKKLPRKCAAKSALTEPTSL